MFKSITLSLVLFTLVSGCSTSALKKSFTPDFNYYTFDEPTIDSISKTKHNVQIYKNTVFYKTDFNEDGNLKSFYDYDFITEDSPCTLMGNSYIETSVFKEQNFNVKIGEKDFQFVCRPVNSIAHSRHFRLFMIGSYHECQSRRWDYSVSLIPYYQKLGKLCANGFKTKANLQVEKDYYKNLKNKAL